VGTEKLLELRQILSPAAGVTDRVEEQLGLKTQSFIQPRSEFDHFCIEGWFIGTYRLDAELVKNAVTPQLRLLVSKR
jgi:hypothetical protein